MARETQNPDTAGKDMDMTDTREKQFRCLWCERFEGDEHTEECRKSGTVGA